VGSVSAFGHANAGGATARVAIMAARAVPFLIILIIGR
jgi:hypothetical protein